MRPMPRSGVMNVRPYEPGKADTPPGARAVKLSSNENPLGASPMALAAYRDAADALAIYPDAASTSLRQVIGARYGLDPARIVCGAGSEELLQLIGRAYLSPGDEVLQTEYGFVVYGMLTAQAGAQLVKAPDDDFQASVDNLIERISDKTRVVFLANPNNPTGTYLSKAEVERLHAALPKNVLLVIDAAYAEYVSQPDYDTGAALVDAHENVLMARTFSKIYGLAALRLGWAYCPAEIADALNRTRGPFNVSQPAMAAGVAALGDEDFERRSREHNDRWIAWLTKELAALGLNVTPSIANFLLVHFPDKAGKTAKDVDVFLSSHGYLLRTLAPYHLSGALRLSVGLEDDNRRIVELLKEFLLAP